MTVEQTTHPAADLTVVRQVLRDSLGYLYPAALRVAAGTSIAHHLADGPKTPERLAELAAVDPSHLRRVLRLLATRGVFEEDVATGAFGNTPISGLLRRDSIVPMRHLVLLFTGDSYWQPTGRLDESVRSGESIYEQVFGAQFFDHLAADAERNELFDLALATMSALEQDAIVAAYDFPESAVVVDVAGGLGGFLRSVLRGRPGLRGVLVDRGPTLARHLLDEPELSGRWETVEADFCVELPQGGDIYTLKRIIHDKNEDECLRILRTCRAAMSPEARLLIIDAVVPPTHDAPSTSLSDILMMAVFEGRERTGEEFRELLAAAGLELRKVIPTASGLSIVEAAHPTRPAG